jgi:uncharacterized protein DUF1566
MKFLKASVLMIFMLLGAIAMLGVLSMRGLLARGGSLPASTLNGDVNCDGRVDLSDAIGIIQFQFYGGPPPCALALDNYATKDELAALAARVDWIANQAIPMSGRRSEGRFKDHGDGTVDDNLTGLQWQQAPADLTGDGKIDADDRFTFAEAIDYSENSTLAGHDDWRIPTPRELQSIADRTVSNPAMDQVFVVNVAEAYWVDERPALDPHDTHALDFFYGQDFIGGRPINFLRMVRTQNPSPIVGRHMLQGY